MAQPPQGLFNASPPPISSPSAVDVRVRAYAHTRTRTSHEEERPPRHSGSLPLHPRHGITLPSPLTVRARPITTPDAYTRTPGTKRSVRLPIACARARASPGTYAAGRRSMRIPVNFGDMFTRAGRIRSREGLRGIGRNRRVVLTSAGGEGPRR